ncbi:MAG: hypothetical protein EPN22_04670 [Nitrospirae bacterium]|nr:MAG: hypothetical protein EPN22_04670 [Nitrospirota bacterium]
MGLLELADQLNDIASQLKAHADGLDDKRFIKEAGRFSRAADRFRQSLSLSLEGFTPQAVELNMHLLSTFSQGEESISGLAKFSQKVLGKKISKSKTDTAASYLSKIFKSIVSAGKTDHAIKALRAMPMHSVLDITGNDELKILEQVRKLGGMNEDQLDFEISNLIKHKKDLFRLADVAKIKYKPTGKPETIAKKLVQTGRRYYENTGGWGLK